MITITDDGARTLVQIAGTPDYLAELADDMEAGALPLDRLTGATNGDHVYGVPARRVGARDVAQGLRDAVERGPYVHVQCSCIGNAARPLYAVIKRVGATA